MSHASVATILVGTLTVATLHALIPSHWLAFAVVGRAQRWTMRQTLTVTALAGTGHILLTVLLGLALTGVGKAVQRAIPERVEHAATAILLILLGLYFLLPTLRGQKGCHHHAHGDPARVADARQEDLVAAHSSHGSGLHRLKATPTAIGALVLGMTLSPCLDLLSVYMAASAMSWSIVAAISLIMTATTLGVMVALVWLTLRGLQRLNLGWLERNEGVAVGGILIGLGLLLFLL